MDFWCILKSMVVFLTQGWGGLKWPPVYKVYSSCSMKKTNAKADKLHPLAILLLNLLHKFR